MTDIETVTYRTAAAPGRGASVVILIAVRTVKSKVIRGSADMRSDEEAVIVGSEPVAYFGEYLKDAELYLILEEVLP